MKLKVDKEKCIGCGACIGIAPEVYEFDDEGFARVKKTEEDKEIEINEENKDAAIEALENCPTEAIAEIKEETQE
jgi:ferredoxin